MCDQHIFVQNTYIHNICW